MMGSAQNRTPGEGRKAPGILVYGHALNANFGAPSVLHGFSETVKRLHPDARIVVYQPGSVDPVAASDFPFPVRDNPYRKHPVKFYRDWLLLKLFGRRPRGASAAAFWDDYRASDVVVNVFPICFCSKIRTRYSANSRLGAIRALLCEFGVGVVARLDGKSAVKATASFGPFEGRANAFLARLVCRFACTRVVAREESARAALVKQAGVVRVVELAPDLANAWPANVERGEGGARLGFSVSYQSEIQWRRLGIDYVSVMRELVLHAARAYGCEIVLLPNQYRKNVRSDDAVAEDIRAGLPADLCVTVFDASKVPPSMLRDALVGCAALVTCRYHSCVAAFAAGVPQLVLGWHDKYESLARWYGQESWVVRTEDCRAETLLPRLDELWRDRARVHAEIAARHPDVVAAVRRSVEHLLADVGPRVSVVLPIFNVEKYLRRSLDALLCQTLRDIEIICVDDGSTDGTSAILAEYAERDARVQVIRQENAGAGVARNTGLDCARGEYLFFCDPDDSCDPKMLQDMYGKAVETSADIVVAGKTIVNADTGETVKVQPLSKDVLRRPQPFSPHDVADRVFSMAKAVPWDKLFRRCFVEEQGLRFQATRRSNDVFFVDMALASATRISALPQCYYRYSLRRTGSLTFVKDDFPFAALEAYMAVETELRARGLWPDFARSFMEVFAPRMLADLKCFREEANVMAGYAKVRAHFLRFRDEGCLDDGLRLSPRFRRLVELVLEQESPLALMDVFSQEREAAAKEKKDAV